MGRATSQHLRVKLLAAQQRGRFAVPSSPNERKAFERRVGRGEIVSPHYGMYAFQDYVRSLSARERAAHALRTVAHLHPDWTFCSFTAALAWGLDVPNALLLPLSVAVGPNAHKRRMRGHLRCRTVTGDEPCTVRGIRVTSLERTLLDCACHGGFRQGLVTCDAALHWGLITLEQVRAYVEQHSSRRHGVEAARMVARYADGRSENGGESIVRAVIIGLGFDVPELQVEVDDPMRPGASRKVDFYWQLPDGRAVILELDGLKKYYADTVLESERGAREVARRFAEERLRESHINLTGATVLRASFSQATNEDYLFRLLVRAGVPLDR